MHYLLDTNTCIYLIKKRPPEVLDQFRQHSLHDVAISAITLFELEYGAQKSQQVKRTQKALAGFFLPLNILDIDRSAAADAAIIRAQLEKKDTPTDGSHIAHGNQVIGRYDLLIAGLARSRKMTLVINNSNKFARIEDLLLEN